jgi:hypothetical protein
MLSGRRYFELSSPFNVRAEKNAFRLFTPFKFDLGERITTDTPSEKDRVVYVLIQVLFYAVAVVLLPFQSTREFETRVNFYFFLRD